MPRLARILVCSSLLPLAACAVDVGDEAIDPERTGSASQAAVSTLGTYTTGTSVVVTYDAMSGSASDWITIADASMPDNKYITYQYTGGGVSGSRTFAGLPPGNYQARAYFDWARTSSWEVRYRANFTVANPAPAPVLTVASPVAPNASIDVGFSGLPGNATDWITIAAAGSAATSFLRTAYTNGAKSGTLRFSGLPAGNYVARAYYDWRNTSSYVIRKEQAFTVAWPTSTAAIAPLGTPTPQTLITVNFSGFPGAASDWVAIAGAAMPDTQVLRYQYTNGLVQGTFTFPPLPAGNYEVRGYANWAGTRSWVPIVRRAFTVSATSVGLGPDQAPAVRACTGPGPAQAVLCVNAAGSGTEAGTAAAPYRTIQRAVNAANSGDTVQVAGGTYTELVAIEAKGVALIGGFAPTFASRNRDLYPTTVRAPTGANGSVITIIDAGESAVHGFVVTGGRGYPDGYGRRSGGGIFVGNINTTGGHAVVANNTLSGNDCRGTSAADRDGWRGGGLGFEGPRGDILYNVIEDNVAGRGAGLAVLDSAGSVVRGNVIRRNVGYSDHGGGVYMIAQGLVFDANRVESNEIGRNVGWGWGGGMFVAEAGTTMTSTNNVFTDNYAPNLGSGLFVDNGAVASLTGDVLEANRCPDSGGAALYVDSLDNSGSTGSTVNFVDGVIRNHACAGTTGNAVYSEGAGTSVRLQRVTVTNDGTTPLLGVSGGTVTVVP